MAPVVPMPHPVCGARWPHGGCACRCGYDSLLKELNFEEVHRLTVKNRVDFYGVPRMYLKSNQVISLPFHELVKRLLGHFDTTSNPLDSSSINITKND